MSTATVTPEAAEPAPRKSRRTLFIALGLGLLGAGGGGGWFFMRQRQAAAEDEEAEDEHAAKATPTFLPLESLVVNLADPGGDRVIQLGIVVELVDGKAAEQVKQYMPGIRSGILMLVSQQTSAELLQVDGKEKLAKAVLREVSLPLGHDPDAEPKEGPPKAKGKRKAKRAPNPVRGVHFSSFLIQ